MRARISCTHSFFRRDGESQVREVEAQVKVKRHKQKSKQHK